MISRSVNPFSGMLLCAFLITLIAPAAWSQQRQPASTDSLALEANIGSAADSLRGNVRLFLDKIEVEGKLEKPQAVFIIPGSNPDIDDIRVERSFFEDIFRNIERDGRVSLRQKPATTTNRKDVLPW